MVAELSRTAFKVDAHFGETKLGTATGFLWTDPDALWIITAKHNVTGLNEAGTTIHPLGAVPDRFGVAFITEAATAQGPAITWGGRLVQLYLDDDRLESDWFQHPDPAVDVAGIRFKREHDFINLTAGHRTVNADLDVYEPFTTDIGMDVFVLGHPPRGLTGGGRLPIFGSEGLWPRSSRPRADRC
jgi:hypothetical protein